MKEIGPDFREKLAPNTARSRPLPDLCLRPPHLVDPMANAVVLRFVIREFTPEAGQALWGLYWAIRP
jgi:hypothetical protein